jgi:two-component system sensor histidine kinase PilS (NtrC family)
MSDRQNLNPSALQPTASYPAENWQLLGYFNIYRVVIAALAVILSIFIGDLLGVHGRDQVLFMSTSLVYLVTGLFSIQVTRHQQPDFETQAAVFAFSDVIFLTLLTRASGGVDSGIGVFMLIAVASSSLLLGKRMTIFIAAMATLGIFIQHSWDLLIGKSGINEQLASGFSKSAILGLAFFATAGLGLLLAQRLRATEALAASRGEDLASLTEINELVIQNLQSGVLVCDQKNRIKLINSRGQQLLGLQVDIHKNTITTNAVSEELQVALQAWKARPGTPLQRPFRTEKGDVLIPRFVALGQAEDSDILIFLDDATILRQQAQQLKMAALARLTASIAHEIRNPLGAISNAAQLLSESITDNPQDSRLIEIISGHCDRMNRIIENITQLARRDRVDQIKINLHEWALEFRQQFIHTVKIEPEAVAVTGDEDIDITVDPDQLYQVVMNLSQNAYRHCPPYTDTPIITLVTGREESGRPFLDITDIGSGISPEIAESIFDPFFTTSSSGTGLGLYIARELCEGNGGGLQCLTDREVGACFRLTFAVKNN